MVEKANKRHKKCFISEADVSSLLQRYTVKTVLALLQEVAQSPGVKLDWNALVKKTSTGISNAREYQMLWRHLAYRDGLLDKLEDEAQPLDDDSDLECDLEACPDVSNEAANEATACVKVLIASGLPSDSNNTNNSTIKAPLTINIPNGQSFRSSAENSQPVSLMQGTNITVPVSVQKLHLSSTSTEALDINGSSANMPPRKRRNPWTPGEDRELIAAVQKYGEGNWANILRGDFKWDRTTSQLSQRWNILKKKNGGVVLGANSNGSRLSEAQLAANHAVSLALDMPVKNMTASCTNNNAGTTSNSTVGNSVPSASNAEALPAGSNFVQAQSQSQQGPVGTKSSPMESPGSAAKLRLASKKMPTKPNFSSESSLRATAVAAGARIVTSSDAAFIKVAQSKNAIHIMPSGVSTVKSSMTGSTPVHLEAHPNVRYIRTGMAAAPPSASPVVTSSAMQPNLVKAATTRVQQNAASEATNAIISSPAAELPLKTDVKVAKEMKNSDLSSVAGNEPSKKFQEDKVPSPKLESELKNQVVIAKNPNSLNVEMVDADKVHNTNYQAEGDQNGNDDKIMGSPVKESKDQSAAEANSEVHISNKEQSDVPNMLVDECSGNPEQLSETKARNEMQKV